MTLRVVDAGSGSELKSIALGSYMPGSAAVAGERLFAGDFGNDFICADMDTGKIVWKAAGEGAPVFSSPAWVSQRVLFGARDMKLHCLNRSDGRKIWSFTTRGDVDSSPVVVGDRVVFGSEDGRLYMVNLKDGTEAWSYEIGRPVKSSPAVANGIIVVGADDGCVVAFGK
jgi:outer membrane protein assembly factor BamB